MLKEKQKTLDWIQYEWEVMHAGAGSLFTGKV